ncbi:MAG: glycine/betaine ABC transporter substrate-binding protein [Alphaproteobacteria bacterium]|nr:glycine/betaine ABC transporter substrate-binding protein [Alphaproteobacteria bacterium]
MIKSTIAAMALGVSVAFTGAASALEMGSDKPIKLAINEWTGQHLSTRVAGAILERAGYNIEYVTAGYGPQFIALGEGDLHATLEIWTSNAPGQFNEAADAGKVIDIGDLGLDAREGVLYPVHMKEMCPGLPSWEALNACAAKFATVDTLPKGRLLDYPADWGSPGKDRFEAMGMNFTAVPAGSEGALITELEASIAKKSPLVMTFWQPHWALAEYDTEWVALPAGTDECYSNASWGVNPNATGDCDFSPTRIFKVTWAGMAETWPMAAALLKMYTLDAPSQQNMMAAVDGRGEDINKVVAAYVDANAGSIDAMISKAKSM